MRHFLVHHTRTPAHPIAALTLRMAVLATPSALIATPRRSYRLTPRGPRTVTSTVSIAAIAARADPHLTITSRAHKKPGIVHRSPQGEEHWTTRLRAVILVSEPCVSADLGAAPDVTAKSNGPGLRRLHRRR